MECQITVEQGTARQPAHIGGLNKQAAAELAPHTQIHVHAVGVAQPLIDVTNEGLDYAALPGEGLPAAPAGSTAAGKSKGLVNRGAVIELRVPAEFVTDDDSPNEATLLRHGHDGVA